MQNMLAFARNKVAPAEKLSNGELASLALIPWGIFIFVCLLFLLLYHRSPGFVLVVVCLGLFFSLVKLLTEQKRATGFQFLLAFFCFIAFFASAFIGLFTYNSFFEGYWASADGHSYANILPSESAAAYADASKVVFADEARIETSQALGFQDGHTYCVAPILDDAPLETVNFWAAGQNCCGARGSFSCDDAWNPNARSGMVIRSSDRVRSEYMNAVRQAEASFEITSTEDPVFVTWVVDAEQLETKTWAIGFGILVVAVVSHLIFSIIVAYAIKRGSEEAREKK